MKRYHITASANRRRPGLPLVQGLNLGSKGAWLIFLAVVFFLVYWVVAGPGSYIFLAIEEKTRAELVRVRRRRWWRRR